MALATSNKSRTLPAGPARGRSGITVRSVAIGLFGVILVCAITPFNDYVLGNTSFTANFLPIACLLFFFLIVVVFQAPLLRFRPAAALHPRELVVIAAMLAVSCTIPGNGLMRYLPSTLVGTYHHASINASQRQLIERLDLPEWMFPRLEGQTISEKAIDPVITDYVMRTPLTEDSFEARWRSVPWAAWITPVVAWGLLLIPLYGAILCFSIIVHRQWALNERLPFPLVGVYLALLESPPAGRALNSTLRSRSFWIGAGIVFGIYLMNGCMEYFPTVIPEIPLEYDLRAIMADPPWSYTDWGFKLSRVRFILLGVAYFLPSHTSFSLWFFFVAYQVLQMAYGTFHTELAAEAITDQQFGALVVYALFIIWIGRRHWLLVLRQMFTGRATRANDGPDAGGYRYAGWGFAAAFGAIIVWLVTAGMSLAGAVVLSGFVMMMMMVVARVVAETGLLFVQIRVSPARPWLYLANHLPESLAQRTTVKSYYLSTMVDQLFTRDLRNALPVYTTHALRLDDALTEDQPRRFSKAPLLLVTGLALAVGYVVAWSSMLYTEYSYASTLARHSTAVNAAAIANVSTLILDPTVSYEASGGRSTLRGHNSVGHLFGGAAITAVCGWMRLRFAAWPLHPAGFLMASTYPMRTFWFSIFLGWLVKAIMIRWGGATLFMRAKPLFLGLILGEASAATTWAILGFVLSRLGIAHLPVHILPA